MIFFDFLKRKKENKKKIIKFQELDTILEIEFKDIEKNIKNIKEQTKQKTLQLISELKNHILNLKSINLEERKEQEKIKFIVKENLNLYISYLQKLIEQLEALDYNDKDYFNKIDSIFNNFKKLSVKSFEKATILIGKELDEVRESIKKFSRNFDKTINGNKNLFEKEQRIIILKNLITELKDKKRLEPQLDYSLQKLEKDLKELEEKKETIKKNLENLKNSDDYAKALEEKEKFNQNIEKIEQEIFELKRKIDFKYLLKYFHNDKNKTPLLKKYAENFKDALTQDANLEIIDIIREIKPDFNTEKLKETRQKIVELKNWKEPLINEQLKKIEEEIEKLTSKIQYIKNEIELEKKKKERFQEKEDEIKKEIKNQAKALWKDIEIDN